jgi:hypothetical protein
LHISCDAGTYFYPRGVRDGLSLPDGATGEEDSGVSADGRPSSHSSSAASQKFLNSGCILGKCSMRVKSLRQCTFHPLHVLRCSARHIFVSVDSKHIRALLICVQDARVR